MSCKEYQNQIVLSLYEELQDGEKVSLNKMIAIAGIPWDENSSFLRGPSEAPPLIRAALFSEASGLRSESGIDFPPDLFVDAGDVPILTGRAMLAVQKIGIWPRPSVW